ncbi:MAG: hypothetical protein A3C47_02080 [Omnitrophica bacterium RIFCSPHIGHO2_02_FULL_51_18]|nr:MAG: hypothetical protein A3C47_02080 [Omnitrophica bacterium RIFCSPHIGHO2_02_FULL_51_18]
MKTNDGKVSLVFLAAVFTAVSVYASNEIAKASISPGRSTHFTVDSSELEPFDLNKKTDEEGGIKFYQDGNTTIGFNEDGGPAVGTRF